MSKNSIYKPQLTINELQYVHGKLFTHLQKSFKTVVMYCQRKMLREIMSLVIDYEKAKVKLRELGNCVTSIYIVGSYLMPETPENKDKVL